MKKITFLVALLASLIISAQEITVTNAGIGLSEPVPGPAPTQLLDACDQGQDGFDINGAAGAGAASGFISAVDILIEPGESFTLESITNLNMLTFAGFLPTRATITYFEDDGSGFFPSTDSVIETEESIPLTINSTQQWTNPAADVHNIDIDVTDITFNGDATNQTKVWIGLQFENNDPNDNGSSFWEIREDDTGGGNAALVGEPLVQFNPGTATWEYIDFGQGAGEETDSEGFYTLNGQCDLLSVRENTLSQISFFPNPSSNIVNVKIPASVDVISSVLYDVLGKRTNVQISNGVLDISNLAKGIYLLNLETSAGTMIEKIIKR